MRKEKPRQKQVASGTWCASWMQQAYAGADLLRGGQLTATITIVYHCKALISIGHLQDSCASQLVKAWQGLKASESDIKMDLCRRFMSIKWVAYPRPVSV